MLEHEKRSVLSFKENSLVYRTEGLRKKLADDQIFVEAFGKKQVDRIYAHMLSYTSLHLAIAKEKTKVITKVTATVATCLKSKKFTCFNGGVVCS